MEDIKLIARHDMAQLCYAYVNGDQSIYLALPRFEGSTPVMYTDRARVKVDNPERFGPHDPIHFRDWAVNFVRAGTETTS